MQPNLFPFGRVLGNPFISNGDLSEGFENSRIFFLVPFLQFQGGEMDLSMVGEKILSSVRSARSLGLLPSVSDRPEVPAQVAAAAAVARALAGLPPHQRYNLSSSSEELSSIYGSIPKDQEVEELEEEFYEEDFDPVRHVLEHLPAEKNDLAYFEKQAALRLTQLDRVAERLSQHVMQNHEVMGDGFGEGIGEIPENCKRYLHEWKETLNLVHERGIKGSYCKFLFQKETNCCGLASNLD